MIVDDDPGVAELQRRRLARAGFRVAQVGDVEAAMGRLNSGGVDLVLIDYRLGPTTGLDLHRRMLAAGFELPVILVSGSMDDSVVLEAMRAGVRDVVVKNTEYLDYLPEAVRGVLHQAVAFHERPTPAEYGECVLVVADDAETGRQDQRELERRGYDVVLASTVPAAIQTLRTRRVSVTAIDWRSGSGLEVHEQLRRDGSIAPAVLVERFSNQEPAIRALRSGVRDLVARASGYVEALGAAVDRIVAQVRFERRLLESELRLASIIGTTMDAIVMCDEFGRIVLFNRSAEELFACSAAEALTSRLGRFIPDLRLTNPMEADAAHPTGAVRERVEVQAIRSAGEPLPIEVSVSDVVVHGRRLFTVIARDVSPRRRIEAELREADRRKDRFLGMLAHELRNPLAAIMNAGEALHYTLQEPRALKLTGAVRRQARALARMVDDLLDISRITLGKIPVAKEPLLLSELVGRSAESLRPVIRNSGLTFDVRVDEDPVWLRGDPTRLEQVLANLLNNAAKFTQAGGTVTLIARREGGLAVIRVRDTGAGIEPGLLPNIFELFVQADASLDRSRGGLGIGLALVRQVVALHGGSVVAASEGLGHGTEFIVRLPVAEDEPAPTDQEGSRGRVVAERRMRILVVDDQPDVADSVAVLVEAFGHEVRAVYGADEALAASRADRPDAMFVDIGMPGMNGYELARVVRKDPDLARVPLVALTGYGREEDRVRARDAGFDMHLIKPVTDGRLEAALAALDDRKARK